MWKVNSCDHSDERYEVTRSIIVGRKYQLEKAGVFKTKESAHKVADRLNNLEV